MELLKCKLTIGQLTFDWVKQVEVESGWEMLTDTATITLPSNIQVNRNELSKQIQAGQKVCVQTGYQDRLHTLFSGYVTEVKPNVPIAVACEDEMWKLKQSTLTASGKSAGLADLLKKHFSGYTMDAPDVEIGNYYMDHISRAKFLAQLKSDFGLYAFFRDGKLVVGKHYNRETARKATFQLDYNMVSDELVFKSKQDIKLKVQAISNQPNGKKIEVELGDSEGESRTLNFYNLSEAELKKTAEREMERLRYDGWRGSFTAFGEPFVRHGDIVTLKHEGKSDRTGKYWVDKVKYTFGTDGYRQEIQLGATA